MHNLKNAIALVLALALHGCAHLPRECPDVALPIRGEIEVLNTDGLRQALTRTLEAHCSCTFEPGMRILVVNEHSPHSETTVERAFGDDPPCLGPATIAGVYGVFGGEFVDVELYPKKWSVRWKDPIISIQCNILKGEWVCGWPWLDLGHIEVV